MALHGTYPRVKDESELQSVGLLQTDDHAVISAYYPQGIDKDDPYDLINLDDYYLTLSGNSQRLEGVAQSRGRLDGRFSLSRY